jgi:hypothetical protein
MAGKVPSNDRPGFSIALIAVPLWDPHQRLDARAGRHLPWARAGSSSGTSTAWRAGSKFGCECSRAKSPSLDVFQGPCELYDLKVFARDMIPISQLQQLKCMAWLGSTLIWDTKL